MEEQVSRKMSDAFDSYVGLVRVSKEKKRKDAFTPLLPLSSVSNPLNARVCEPKSYGAFR